jgi:hypothetical protein
MSKKGYSSNYSTGICEVRIASYSEVGRLKSTATRNNATSVIAKVHNGSTSINYAKTKQSVKL